MNTLRYEGSVDLRGLTFASALVEIEGDVTVTGVCTLMDAEIRCTGVFEARVPLTAADCLIEAKAGFIARDSVHLPRTNISGGLVTLLSGGSVRTIAATELRTFGTLIAQNVTADHIFADGDLIVDGPCIAKTVTAERGQIFAPRLTAGVVKAAILANYTEDRLPDHYEFGWSRPIPPGYNPGEASLAKTKHSSFLMLQHFCGHVKDMHVLLDELMTANDCQSFDHYFTRLFPFLREHYNELKPAAQEMLECFERGGFPSEFWRY